MKDILNKVIDTFNICLLKSFSGKFILTVLAGMVFTYCSIKGLLKAETVSAIVSMVFIKYFDKKKDE